MISESTFKRKISDDLFLNQLHFHIYIEEYSSVERGTWRKLNPIFEIGWYYTLHRAKKIIERAIKRKLSIIEWKNLQENKEFILPGWQLKIERQ